MATSLFSSIFPFLLSSKKTTEHAYTAGYDCGTNGPSVDNCSFAFFTSVENTKAWQRGKQDAVNGKPMQWAIGNKQTTNNSL